MARASWARQLYPDSCLNVALPKVPLVFVWQEDDDSPPVQRFRELLLEWKSAGKLWHGRPAGEKALR